MRKFLYITPYFPPQSRVGALRPLKFARHLPQMGWAPVVLCDLWDEPQRSLPMLEAVPPDTIVIRDYSRRARAAEAAMDRPAPAPRVGARKGGPGWQARLPTWLNNPELVPLGEHSVHMPHAYQAALRALEAHPECEAIMVNADPYASLLVGAMLSRRTGLPLVQDLRDPWSVCELRRHRRPAPIRALVDAMERWAFHNAARVILNTETTLRDYRAHYAGVLPPERFTCIRNHHDRALIQAGDHGGFERFTLLFLGHFRRFVEGDVLLEVLAALSRRGLGEQVQLVITGTCPESTWEQARALGVEGMLKPHPFVPYPRIGPVMDAADVLVALNNRTVQRIPAKLYDYATTRRPILTMADSPEVSGLVARLGGATFGLDDPEGAAAWIETLVAAGRGQEMDRDGDFLSSRTASRTLATILDEVTGRG